MTTSGSRTPLPSGHSLLRNVCALVLTCAPLLAAAHGGGLDASGCHNERRTGDYHCHRAPAVNLTRQPSERFVALERAAPASADRRAVPVCYVGPKGGTYTLSPSGRKNYSGC